MSQLHLPVDAGEGGPELRYLTITEAAERVRVCERTVRRAIDAGNLRAACVRGSRAERGVWRIHPADLDRWLFEEPAP